MYLGPMRGGPGRIRCFAKINLGLRVLARRDDGFHELRSVLHTIDLHDTLELLPSEKLSLEIRYEGTLVEAGGVPEGDENLVMKAARAAGAVSGRLVLTKRIPAGSGLGGGSSDAAGALMALAGARLPQGRLHELAASLGSDVPFFLYGGAALALGRGEEVYPLEEGPQLHLVLGFPGQPLSTPEVYRAWDDSLTSPRRPDKLSDFAPWGLSRGEEAPAVANDLEEAAIRIRPSLKKLRSTLDRSGARAVAMTGSGSTFYGIFGDATSAREAARRVEEAGFAAIATRSLGREERTRCLWETAGRTGD